MKKFFGLTIAVILLFGFAACNRPTSDNSSSAYSENSQPEASYTPTTNESLDDEITGLESEISSLRQKLSDTQAENDTLQQQLDGFRDIGKVIQTVYVKNGVYLTVAENHSPVDATRLPYTVSIEYEDGKSVEVLNHRYIWMVKPSPDGSKVILNDLEMEITATVFLYDVEKRETKKLTMPALPADTTPAYMAWLDNRYFLFTVQLDNGSVVRGGDVYIYDTETDEYKPIIVNSDTKFQTVSFEVYNLAPNPFDTNYVLFSSVLYEDTRNFAGNVQQILTVEEIFGLMEGNRTIDLSIADIDSLSIAYN